MRDLGTVRGSRNKKGQLGDELPFFRPQGRDEPHIAWPGLRQVVAERGPDHVVDGVRTNTGPCHASGGIEVVTGPAVLGDVGVSQPPLHAALRSVVDLMPEAKGPKGRVQWGLTYSYITKYG